MYVGILGLGLAGVAVDRLWLGAGPSSASAASLPDNAEDLSVQSSGSGGHNAVVSVAKRLEGVQAGMGGDAFVLPASWVPKPAASEQDAGAVAAAAAGEKAKPRANRVSSIIGRGATVAVVIDDHIYRLGEPALDGVRLLRVEGDAVTIESDGQVVELTVKVENDAKKVGLRVHEREQGR